MREGRPRSGYGRISRVASFCHVQRPEERGRDPTTITYDKGGPKGRAEEWWRVVLLCVLVVWSFPPHCPILHHLSPSWTLYPIYDFPFLGPWFFMWGLILRYDWRASGWCGRVKDWKTRPYRKVRPDHPETKTLHNIFLNLQSFTREWNWWRIVWHSLSPIWSLRSFTAVVPGEIWKGGSVSSFHLSL